MRPARAGLRKLFSVSFGLCFDPFLSTAAEYWAEAILPVIENDNHS